MPFDFRVVIPQTKQVRSRCAHGASLLSCKASFSGGACLWGAGDEAAPPLLAHDDVIGEAINWTEEGDIKLKATPSLPSPLLPMIARPPYFPVNLIRLHTGCCFGQQSLTFDWSYIESSGASLCHEEERLRGCVFAQLPADPARVELHLQLAAWSDGPGPVCVSMQKEHTVTGPRHTEPTV